MLLANAMVAMYLFLGSGRGGASLAKFFATSIHGSKSSSSGMATTLWSRVDSSNFEPQVICYMFCDTALKPSTGSHGVRLQATAYEVGTA